MTHPSDLSNCDLLFSRCQIRAPSIPQPTAALPGVLIKLHAAVETVTCVYRPVTAGFALRECVPRAPIAYRGHLRTRLCTDAQEPVTSRCRDDIGYWHSTGLRTIDGGHGKGNRLQARGSGVLGYLSTHVQRRVRNDLVVRR